MKVSRRSSNNVLYLLLFCVAAYFAAQLRVSSDAGESLLPTTGYKADKYQQFLDNYRSDKAIRLVWEDVACTEQGWPLLQELEAKIIGSSYVLRVSGLSLPDSVFPSIEGERVVLDSLSETEFSSASDRCDRAESYDLFRRALISTDRRAVSTNILLADAVDSNEAISSLQELVAPYSKAIQATGGRLYFAGESVMSAEILKVTNQGTKLVLLMPLLAAVIVLVISGSLQVAILSVVTCVYSIVLVLGFMAATGISSTPITSLVTFLLIPISSAFVIHAYGFRTRNSTGTEQGSADAFYVAGITTAIGFGSTAISQVPDIRAMGLVGFVGVLVSTNFVTGFVLPRLRGSTDSALTPVVPVWAVASVGKQLVICIIIFAVSLAGLSRLYVSYVPTDYLPLSNSVRANFERLIPWFGRLTIPLTVQLPDGLDDLPTWRRTKELVDIVSESEDDVVRVSWQYQQIATMTQAITFDANGADLDFPNSNEMLRQVYETLDFGGRDQYVAADESELLVLFDVSFLGSDSYLKFQKEVLRHAGNLNLEAEFVGRVPYFFEIGHSIAAEVAMGLVITLLLISVLFYFYLDSFGLALVSSLTNLVPVLVGVSVFGILNVPLDLGSAIVAAIAFGLVIDDSTHYLVRYKQLRKMGYDAGSAVLRCSRELSGVIALTTVSIVACFMALLFVELSLFHDFAYLIAVTMVAAMITDLYILPRVLILVDGDNVYS